MSISYRYGWRHLVGSIYIDVDQMWIFLEVGVGMVGTFSADL